jgi:hypothetical protein
MNAKYWFLVTVVAFLVGWAGLETQRLIAVKRQLAASTEVQQVTSQHLAAAQLKHAHTLADKK